MKHAILILFVAIMAQATWAARGQTPQSLTGAAQDALESSGQVDVQGRRTPYVIHHLPVSSFPELPAAAAALLTRRGCTIPQTYQAHEPENVIHASFERAGSSDWAVLCSTQGTVSLLVYLASSPAALQTLASAPETTRLQTHDVSGVLGFNWGIDAASPARVHEAQAGMEPRPAMLDHDALADSVIDHGTTYRFYTRGKWAIVETPDE